MAITRASDNFFKDCCYSTNIIIDDNPTSVYLIEVNNRNIRKRYKICSKLTIKTPERRQWRRSGVFIVNFEHISHIVLVLLLLTLNMYLPAGKSECFYYTVTVSSCVVMKDLSLDQFSYENIKFLQLIFKI